MPLNRHIREGWGTVVAGELGEFIEILPLMQRVSKSWYQNRRRCLSEHLSHRSGRTAARFIPPATSIYKMNYALMKEHHRNSGADITLATLPVTPDQVSQFGVVEVAASVRSPVLSRSPRRTNIRLFDLEMVDVSMASTSSIRTS